LIQWPCITGEREWEIGQPMTPAKTNVSEVCVCMVCQA
jgi:hypothetical protein